MPVYDLSKKKDVEKRNANEPIVFYPLDQVQQNKAWGKHVMLNAVKEVL